MSSSFPKKTAEDVAMEQGWNDVTMLGLCRDFIGESCLDEKFVVFLQSKAEPVKRRRKAGLNKGDKS